MVSKDARMKQPQLELSFSDGRRCKIFIGPGTLSNPNVWESLASISRVAVVTNETVYDLYASRLLHILPVKPDFIYVEDGEEFKTLKSFEKIIDELIDLEHDRNSLLIALGGGVIGDLAGFAASSYQRGIGLVQVPTTLLSQVDSAIGGKTAVNHERGKNMIGAFYQPQLVVIDTQTLSSLPRRVYVEGLAEVVKYGIIKDHQFFSWLEQNAELLLNRDQTALAHAVRVSCKTKSQIVEFDERETDLRLVLNFGHTFGHGIENAAGYGSLLHGEAVSIGMVLASDLSVRLGLLSSNAARRIERLLKELTLPTQVPSDIPIARILDAMKRDKKAFDARQRHIVARDIGTVSVQTDIEPTLVTETLQNRIAG